jgi:hypothetical protein
VLTPGPCCSLLVPPPPSLSFSRALHRATVQSMQRLGSGTGGFTLSLPTQSYGATSVSLVSDLNGDGGADLA